MTTEPLAEVERSLIRARMEIYARRNGEDLLRRMNADRMTWQDKAWVRDVIRVVVEG